MMRVPNGIQYSSQLRLIYTITYPVDYPQIRESTSLCLDRNNCITTDEPVTPALDVTPSHPDPAMVLQYLARNSTTT